MFVYKREICKIILNQLRPNKVNVILGARRTGKTYLLKELINKINDKTLFLNGEDFVTGDILSFINKRNYENLLADNKVLVIDEAQKIKNIGNILKFIVDTFNNIYIFASGSSAFDLSNKTGEPLTGRKFTYMLYPLSTSELMQKENYAETLASIDEKLIFGSYPEIINEKNTNTKRFLLNDLVNSYLLKDILELENLKNSSKLLTILKQLAFQIGNQVSINELAGAVGLNNLTVEKYLDLLTKVFVIFKLGGYNKNLRKELTKQSKYYFWDLGIRNAIINNFSNLNMRDDVGKLWENYIISEMLKKNSNNSNFTNYYFWRTYDRQEIDLIAENNGQLIAYEIKYNKQNAKIPAAWAKTYSNSKFEIINNKNYLNYLS
jgi:hypothetical protein